MQLEEVEQVLDKPGIDTFNNEKETAAGEVGEGKSFVKEVGAKVARARGVAAKAGATTRGGRRKKKKGGEPGLEKPASRAIPTMRQEGVVRRVPPAGSLWLGKYQGGTWQAHFQPFQRISRAFAKRGREHECLKLCREYPWRSYCQLEGFAEPDCPLHGILGEVAGPLNAASSSSAASADPCAVSVGAGRRSELVSQTTGNGSRSAHAVLTQLVAQKHPSFASCSVGRRAGSPH